MIGANFPSFSYILVFYALLKIFEILKKTSYMKFLIKAEGGVSEYHMIKVLEETSKA